MVTVLHLDDEQVHEKTSTEVFGKVEQSVLKKFKQFDPRLFSILCKPKNIQQNLIIWLLIKTRSRAKGFS